MIDWYVAVLLLTAKPDCRNQQVTPTVVAVKTAVPAVAAHREVSVQHLRALMLTSAVVEWPSDTTVENARKAAPKRQRPAYGCCCSYCYDQYDECIWQCDLGPIGERAQCYNNCSYALDLCLWNC